MICGDITLEDHRIIFEVSLEDDSVDYIVIDTLTGDSEKCRADGQSFMNALSIAVHWDGTPDFIIDYPSAENIQGKIRWIP